MEILRGWESSVEIWFWLGQFMLLLADNNDLTKRKQRNRYLPLSTMSGSVSPGRISSSVLELIGPLGKLVFLVLDMNIWLSYVSYWVLKDNNSFSPYIFCQYLANCIVMVCPSLARSTNVSLSCVVMKLMALLLLRPDTTFVPSWPGWFGAPSLSVTSEMINSSVTIQLFLMRMHHQWLPWQSTKLKALFGLTGELITN